MREFHLEELSVGMKESFSKVITEKMMLDFLGITGDENPLHSDSHYARTKGYSERVVYGMLTASLISTLGGCYLPGKYCLIQSVEIKFVKPVYIGDELTLTGEIVQIETDLRYIKIKVNIRNQKTEKVLRGLLKVRVLDE